MINSLCASLSDLLDWTFGISPRKLSVLTYKEVVKHFTRIHLEDPRVKKGMVVRRPSPRGKFALLALICVDEWDQPVLSPKGESYTAEYWVRDIDDELKESLFNGDGLLQFSFE